MIKNGDELLRVVKKVEAAYFSELNDFATFQPGLVKGGTEIWYCKPSRGQFDSYEFREKQGTLPEPKDLSASHVLLGKISERNLGKIYDMMQGENWSPEGEANMFIRGKGLHHTSMSVGDIIKIGGKVYFCDSYGFTELKPSTVYRYYINLDERGSFYADVRDSHDKTVYEIKIEGDPENDSTIFEDGYMSMKDDISGLEEYLKQLRIIPKDGMIIEGK
jgi:hypothetical protein